MPYLLRRLLLLYWSTAVSRHVLLGWADAHNYNDGSSSSSIHRRGRFVSFGKWYLNNNDYHQVIPCSSVARIRGTNNAESSSLVSYLTEPLIRFDVWNSLTGREWQEHPEALDELARMGEQLARDDRSNEWVEWHVHGNQNHESLEDGAIHVWTGKTHKTGYYGSELPFVKTRSIIPLSPKEMVDLMMDSSRVKEYNPWSTGRKDCWVSEDGFTKIVQNRVQPPLGAKPMISTTLLHARPLEPSSSSSFSGGWIIISRAVGGGKNALADTIHNHDQTNNHPQYGQSEILLGVNMLEPILGNNVDDEDSCVFTAVNHMYSSAVPMILAERVGVKSAIKFVKDMRKLKVPAS